MQIIRWRNIPKAYIYSSTSKSMIHKDTRQQSQYNHTFSFKAEPWRLLCMSFGLGENDRGHYEDAHSQTPPANPA